MKHALYVVFASVLIGLSAAALIRTAIAIAGPPPGLT